METEKGMNNISKIVIPHNSKLYNRLQECRSLEGLALEDLINCALGLYECSVEAASAPKKEDEESV